jgi:hypothetical protein
MYNQKVNNKAIVEEHVKKLKRIEDGYLNIVENTLKALKEQKSANLHHLKDIECLLEHYKNELEYIDQKNKEMCENILKLIENKKFLHNKVKDDLETTDKHIQLIQIQRKI